MAQVVVNPTESPLSRCHLNRLHSPLLRLPPELFPVILYTAIDDVFREELSSWIYLGRICHELRTALLGMHSLWADVVFDPQYPGGLDEILRRAGNHPVVIHLKPYLGLRMSSPEGLRRPSERARRAIALLSRARVVRISYSRECIESVIAALAQSAHPALEQIFLDVGTHREDPLMILDQPSLLTPNLRILELTSVFIPVNVSGLTELTLKWSCPSDTPMLDARAFADMLCGCDKLEILHLFGWLPDCPTSQALHREGYRISLPRLAYLNLSHAFQSILDFWAILFVPISTKVLTSVDEYEETCELGDLLNYIRSLRPFVPQTQSAAGVSKISKLAIYYDYEEHLTFGLGSHHGNEAPFGQQPRLRSRLHGTGCPNFFFNVHAYLDTPSEMASFLECVCTTFQLHVEDIVSLNYAYGNTCLRLDEHNQDAHVVHTMFPAVTELRLNDIQSDPAYILSSSNSLGLSYYPNLRALHIDESHETFNSENFEPADVERLIDAIQTRVIDHGRPLRLIALEAELLSGDFGPDVERRCLKRLEALVPHVRLDITHGQRR